MNLHKYKSQRSTTCQDRKLLVYKIHDLIENDNVYLSPKNRTVDPDHVRNLTDTFKIEYCQPITVYQYDDKFLIVDGQHRYKALLEIYDNENHPHHHKLLNWEVILDVHDTGRYEDLLFAFNRRRDFKEEQIETDKFVDIVKILNEKLVLDDKLLIRKNTRAPYVDEDKFLLSIQGTGLYIDNDAENIVKKIFKVNTFLCKSIKIRDGTYWKPKNTKNKSYLSKKIIEKMRDSKVMLGCDSKYEWIVLLNKEEKDWKTM